MWGKSSEYKGYVAASKAVIEWHEEKYNDAQLVAAGAKQHGVKVVQGDIFKIMSQGDYNPRLPKGTDDEARLIQKAQKLLVVCEDYRQSGQVAQQLGFTDGNNPIFATAGAVVQPESNRFGADVNWLLAVLNLNPNILIMMTHHIGVCGGANHFTGGNMAETRERSGESGEILAMRGYADQMYNAVKSKAPSAQLQRYLVRIGADNHYAGLEQII